MSTSKTLRALSECIRINVHIPSTFLENASKKVDIGVIEFYAAFYIECQKFRTHPHLYMHCLFRQLPNDDGKDNCSIVGDSSLFSTKLQRPVWDERDSLPIHQDCRIREFNLGHEGLRLDLLLLLSLQVYGHLSRHHPWSWQLKLCLAVQVPHFCRQRPRCLVGQRWTYWANCF